MIYYCSVRKHGEAGPGLFTIKMLTVAALALYPAGALTLALGPDGLGGLYLFEIVGLGLIFLSLLAATPVLGSRLQRIVAEKTDLLDEFEMQLRLRATTSAYGAFAGLILAGIVYAAIAADFGWWLPRSYDEYNGLFWGVFLYATLLPTAFLAWSPSADGAGEPE